MNDARSPLPRIMATFVPYAYRDDDKVGQVQAEPRGETEWDVTRLLLASLALFDIEERTEGARFLRTSAHAPAWVEAWEGPFEIEFENSLQAFRAALFPLVRDEMLEPLRSEIEASPDGKVLITFDTPEALEAFRLLCYTAPAWQKDLRAIGRQKVDPTLPSYVLSLEGARLVEAAWSATEIDSSDALGDEAPLERPGA